MAILKDKNFWFIRVELSLNSFRSNLNTHVDEPRVYIILLLTPLNITLFMVIKSAN